MPASSKLPGDIAERVERGEKPADVAREYGVSRHAVEKRAKRNAKVDDAGNITTDWLPVVSRDFFPCGDRDSPEIRADILAAIESGGTIKSACESVGISEDTFKRWRDRDSDLADCVAMAQSRVENLLASRWLSASERDWRAAESLLKSSPAYRDRWGGGNGDGKTGGINIVLNMPSPTALSDIDQAKIIDVEPVTEE